MNQKGYDHLAGLLRPMIEEYADKRVSAALEKRDAEKQEIARLREALFQVVVHCGEDTDGARSYTDLGKITPGIDVWAVEAVKQLRADYEEDSA